MMATAPEKFTSQAAPELLAAMRGIAQREGREFEEVLEEAMAGYIESKNRENVRPEVKALYQASVQRHRRLYELLAQ